MDAKQRYNAFKQMLADLETIEESYDDPESFETLNDSFNDAINAVRTLKRKITNYEFNREER